MLCLHHDLGSQICHAVSGECQRIQQVQIVVLTSANRGSVCSFFSAVPPRENTRSSLPTTACSGPTVADRSTFAPSLSLLPSNAIGSSRASLQELVAHLLLSQNLRLVELFQRCHNRLVASVFPERVHVAEQRLDIDPGFARQASRQAQLQRRSAFLGSVGVIDDCLVLQDVHEPCTDTSGAFQTSFQ